MSAKTEQPGKYILVEGIDGSGKSTQYELLVARLRESGSEVVAVREPGGTVLGEKARSLVLDTKQAGEEKVALWAETMLFLAARAQLIEEVIRPALARGATVVSDRGFFSTIAYQGYGRGLDIEGVEAANSLVCGDTMPDLTVLVDIPVDMGTERRTKRAGVPMDRMEAAGNEFMERVAEGFLQLATSRYRENSVLVDGAGEVSKVADAIWEAVKERGLAREGRALL